MAAPMVSGGIALLLEQFHTLFDLDLDLNAPFPALIRGILIHTARDLIRPITAFLADSRIAFNPDTHNAPTVYGAGPDFATGFGLIDLEKAMALIEQHTETPTWIEGTIGPNEMIEIPLVVHQEGPLKVTLVWDDIEGSILTPAWENKLVYNLDLQIRDEAGNLYGPWVLKPPPLKPGYEDGIDDLAVGQIEPAIRCKYEFVQQQWIDLKTNQPPLESIEDLEYPRLNQGCLDELNPQEQVLIDSPSPQKYWIQIKSKWTEVHQHKWSVIWSQECSP